MSYLDVLDEEVQAEKPAKATTWQKFRDNLPAAFAHDVTGDPPPELVPQALLNPTSSTAVAIASCPFTVRRKDMPNDDPDGVEWAYFHAVCVVPGVYRVTGTFTVKAGASQKTLTIEKDGTSDYTTSSSGGVDHSITAVNGTSITIKVQHDYEDVATSVLADFKLVADHACPMAQCQFFKPNEVNGNFR